jgi:polyisoprenoid-binding protein YceI
MTATLSTRLVDGAQLPTSGTFTIDPSHSEVGFVVRHVMVGKTRGRFVDFEGEITVADDPLVSSVRASISTASVDTHDEGRDGHLRSDDFLAVEAHPTMTFQSTAVRAAGRGEWDVDGDLTILGITRPVTLHVEYEGVAADPWGGERVGFTARTEINREDWGLTWNQVLETGGVLVGKKVKIELEIEAVRQA